jgi:hypothetical protein
MRIGFLYNHDAPHQVMHSASIVEAILKQAPDTEVSLLASSQELLDTALDICGPAVALCIQHRVLGVPAIGAAAAHALDFISPASRVYNLFAHRKLLGSFDALVVTERTSLVLRRFQQCDRTALIYISHGAGDRAIGFQPDIAKFDLILLSGDKLRQRFLAKGDVADNRIRIVGYPKLDSVKRLVGRDQPVFNNGKPVVLYNPHFEPYLSSWYKMGEHVLDYFLNTDRYNLIFAPHVMLFRRHVHISLEHRTFQYLRALAKKYRNVPNIHIDLGSRSSIDMTYARQASIYVGDVSSQVYEFLLLGQRPCIFLNAHGAKEWQRNPDYRFWAFGPVVTDIDGLIQALAAAPTSVDQYRAVQAAALQETFSVCEATPSSRAAHAILTHLRPVPRPT